MVVPDDEQLVFAAEAIVIATVQELHSEFALDGTIVTNIDVEPELVLKGAHSVRTRERLRIVEPGGVVGEQIMVVSTAPTYWLGNRALIFLNRTTEGTWRTYGAPLGKFDFVRDAQGRELAVRWATREHAEQASLWRQDGRPYEERARDAARFIAWIQRVLQTSQPPFTPVFPGDTRETATADYFVENPTTETTEPEGWDPASEATYPPSAYTQGTFRWDVFDKGSSVTFRVNGTQPGYDSTGAAQRGLAAWTNDPGSNVNYVYGGTSTAGFVADNQNTIVYNSPTGVPAGAIAYAQWFGGASHTYKGETFYSITEGDVVVKSNLSVSQKVFEEAVTHELGHTLGFRHSDSGTPYSTEAVMKSVLTGSYGSTLGPWDIEAVRTVYESTLLTTAPTVPANLVATATSTSSVTITWSASTNATGYQLERSSNNGAFVQIATPTTTSYVDSGLSAGVTYVYRVRATGSGGTSAYSNVDHATTIVFADDPLVPGVTVIRAVHLTQLRQAVNAVRAAAGLSAVSWTDSSPTGVVIKAVHIEELRNALTPALTALGKTALYTDALLTPGATVVKAVHFQELRNLTK